MSGPKENRSSVHRLRKNAQSIVMRYAEFDPMFEMSNFDFEDTGLPRDITIWLRADPKNHGHSRYRLKVEKNNQYQGTFLIGSNPRLVDPVRSTLTDRERNAVENFIRDHAQALINHIDGHLSSGGLGRQLQKTRGELGNNTMKTYLKEE